MRTCLTTRGPGVCAAALVAACLVGCQGIPLADSSEPVAEQSSDQSPKPVVKKKLAKPAAGDSIPDAAAIGLAPADGQHSTR